jgi:replicative DNA helicase
MYEQSKPIDLTTLAESLGSRLAEVGGITYLAKLTDVLSSRNIKAYGEIVKNKSILRTLKQNLVLAQKQIEKETNPEEIISLVKTNIKFENREENGDVAPAVEEFLKDLENRYNNGGDINGIKTHFRNLDDILGGLHRQELIIIGARPSMGKSVMATNLTTNISLRSNKKVAIFSLEMNGVSLVKRMVSNLAKVDSYDLRDGNINDSQWQDITKASSLLVTDRIKLYEVTMSLNKIIAECKRLKIQNGLDVVIIDYLQLIQGTNKENRQQEVSDISRKLKLLAKELNITVIALSQLSRNVESRTDKRPGLADLRESGSIEQDADVVLFLYRDEYYNPETEDRRTPGSR